MVRKFIYYGAVFFLFLVIIPGFITSFAATILFDPTTVAAGADDTFDIKVDVDSGEDEIKGVEAYIIYDSTAVELTNIEDAASFPLFDKKTSAGKIYVAGVADQTDAIVSGQVTLATLTFKALADSSSKLELFCESTKGSSIIKNDSENTNIIECTESGTADITVGTGTESTDETEPTAEPAAETAADDQVPAELPKSGVFDNVVKYAVPGLLLFFIGVGAKFLL